MIKISIPVLVMIYLVFYQKLVEYLKVLEL